MTEKREKKIAIDVRMVTFSGIGTYLYNNLRFLLKGNYNTELLGNPKDVARLFPEYKGQVTEVNSKIYTPQEQLEFRSKVSPCTVFWSPNYNYPLLARGIQHKVVTIHDINHLQPWFREGHWKDRIKSYVAEHYIGRALKVATKIITVSNFTKQALVDHFKVSGDKIEVIHLGVDHKTFHQNYTDEQVAAAKQTYKIEGKYIVYLGNIKPHKNLYRLVNAYSQLPESLIAEYKLVIAGQFDRFAERHANLYTLIDSLPEAVRKQIVFTGFVKDEDLPVLLKGASLMTFPSLYEGFGLPPLEAMACGCPVVASNVTSIPEVCEDAVIYFDPYNEESISNAIKNMLTEESVRQAYIQKSLAHVQKFQWEKCASKHIEIFDRLVNA